MLYSATVKDATGSRRTILREAGSSSEVVSGLRAEGFLVLDVVAARGVPGQVSPLHPAWLLPMTSFDVELGLRQLAAMLKSGVSLVESLQTVAEQGRNPRTRRVWRLLADRVLAGVSFADALAEDARRFGEVVVRLARVGEQSGELEVALTRAAEHLESRRNLRTLVTNALVYPVLAVTMTIAVTAFLVVVVIPKIAAFLQAGGASMPQMTQILVDLSTWITTHAVALVGSLTLVVGAWCLLRLFPWGRELEDAFALRIPVSGKILRLSATAVFARALQTMLASGVGLIEALEVGSKLMTNHRIGRRVARVRDEVMRGNPLATSLAEIPEFLPMLNRMAAVGEMTGALAETFGETARFHEMMLSVAIRRFSVLIEPVMICVTGVIVGFVYVAFFLAVFAIAGTN